MRTRIATVAVIAALVLTTSVGAASAVAGQPAAGPGVVATIHVPGGAEVLAANPRTNRVYIGNQNDDRISVLDGSTDTITATGHGPCCGLYGIATNPRTNKVYAAGVDDNHIVVLDGSTNAILARVNFPDFPYAVAANVATGTVYVDSLNSNAVVLISGQTNRRIRTIHVGTGPTGLAVNPLSNTVYFADTGGNAVAGPGRHDQPRHRHHPARGLAERGSRRPADRHGLRLHRHQRDRKRQHGDGDQRPDQPRQGQHAVLHVDQLRHLRRGQRPTHQHGLRHELLHQQRLRHQWPHQHGHRDHQGRPIAV